MKKLCLLILTILIAIPVYSQLEKGYVHLKNGTVLKGKYQYSDGKIHIVSAGNLWNFEASEVDTITGTRFKSMKSIQNLSTNPHFFFRMETGLLVGNSQNSQSAPLSLTGSANYLFNPQFSVGFGFGAEFFKESYLPLFLNLEYKFRDIESSPYLFFKGGYEVALEDGGAVYYDIIPLWSSVWPGPYYGQDNLKAKGGIMINPGIGYTYMLSYSFGISVAVGYQFHRLQYKVAAEEEKDYGLDIDYNRLSVKIGILFN